MIFFFFFLFALSYSERIMEGNKELLLVQTIWRHGDRSPTSTYKKDPYKESYWKFGGGGWGQLSPIGMAQHAKLGTILRDRYVDSHYKGYLSNYYNSKEVYYRSTDVNRTIISAMANMIGMWSQPNYNNREMTDYPNSTYWPAGYVPIAVHTVDDHTDYIGNADAHCHRHDQLWDMAESSPEVTDFNSNLYVKDLLDYLTSKCGEKITTGNIFKVADSFLIEKIHCPDFYKKVPWYSDQLNAQVVDVNDQMELYKNGVFENPLIMNGLDIGLELKKIKGGSMTNDVNMHMNIKLDCFLKNKTDGGCQWIHNLKYYVYSAHDTTVYAFFSCLGIQSRAVTPHGYPKYSATVLIELWYDHETKEPFFKMLYHKEDGAPFESITEDIPECQGNSFCPLDVYRTYSQRVKPDMPMPQWCEVDPRTQNKPEIQGMFSYYYKYLQNAGFLQKS